MTQTTDELRAWIGRSETVHDTVHPTPVAALTATLDHPAADTSPGTPLPPLWHWLYFLPLHRQSDIGADGHARRGGFLPPVPLPRRMWAGSQFDFIAPIRVGDRVARTSTIEDVSSKEGRTGKLVFVKVRHEIRCNGASAPALVEFHDIVYRDAQQPGDVAPPPQAAPAQAAWRRQIVPDDVLLFRYSALTFNAHRIHYDHPYVTREEGYPGLVVHGPLTATLLLEAFRNAHPDKTVRRFAFRAVGPLYDHQPFDVCGALDGPGTARLWSDCDGRLTMKADVSFSD